MEDKEEEIILHFPVQQYAEVWVLTPSVFTQEK